MAHSTPSPVSLALSCGNCQRDVSLSYVPGPRPIATTYFCPYCHRVNRLEVPGEIRGVSKAHVEIQLKDRRGPA